MRRIPTERELMAKVALFLYENVGDMDVGGVCGMMAHMFVASCASAGMGSRMTKLETRDYMHKHVDLIFDDVWNGMSSVDPDTVPRSASGMRAAINKAKREGKFG